MAYAECTFVLCFCKQVLLRNSSRRVGQGQELTEWAKGLVLWLPSPECNTFIAMVRPKRFGIFGGKLGDHYLWTPSKKEQKKKQLINVSLLLYSLLLLRNNWVKKVWGNILWGLLLCMDIWNFGVIGVGYM